MPLSQAFVFNEVSPSAPGAAVSSQIVSGVVAPNIPVGVCGPLSDFKGLMLVAELVGATGGTLDVSLESSTDGGNSWFEFVHFPQLSAGHAAVIYAAPVSLACGTSTTVVTGKGAATALAANVVVNGAWGDRVRLLMTAGSGTTAGAAVVVRVTGQRPRIREAGGR